MKKKLLLFSFLFSTLSYSRDLSLEEAIELVLNNNKKIEVSSKKINIGEINIEKTFKTSLPNIIYEGGYSRDKKSYNKDETNRYTNQISITQPIFHGGEIFNNIKGAKTQVEIEKLLFIKEKINLRLSIIKIFSDIVMDKKNLEALLISKKELEIRLKEQENKLTLKLITKADLLKTKVAFLDIESQITKIKNQMEINMRYLKIETGINNEENLNLIEFAIPESLSKNINFDKDLIIAQTQSVDSLIANYNLKYAKIEKNIAISENLPKIDAFAQYGGENEKNLNNLFENEEWRVGVKFTWGLFNFGSGIDNYKIAMQNYKIKELNKEIIQENIEKDLITAYKEIIRIEKEREVMKISLEASLENYQIDSKRYEKRIISVQDYLNSEAQLRKSKLEYNKIEADYLYALEKYRSLLI